MSLFYFVEILNGSGDVLARHKFSYLPIRLGRSYQNDIILDDPHTAADHAILEQDENGDLFIRDLGSQNGISLQGKRASQFKINGDNVFQLGQTHIRVRDSRYVVTAEITDATNHRWQGWPLLAIAVALICVLSLSNTWLSDFNNGKASSYVISLAYWLGFSSVWAGIWALANRVFGGSAHFTRHLFTLSCGMAALDLVGYLGLLLGFGLSLEFFTGYSSHIQIAIVATTIYYHLRQIRPHKRTRMKIVCVLLGLLGSGLMLNSNYQNTNQYADELYMHEMLPPAMRLSRDHDLADFDQQITKLKAQIDAEREKTLKEKAQKK